MQHLQPNTTLQGGKYRIEKLLGQGGFGITYLAEQSLLKIKVAIKEFFIRDLCDRDDTANVHTITQADMVERYRKKFFKEAQILARLKHHGLVQVTDIFEENGTAYYVMEYVEGESLADIIKRNGPLPEQTALRYISKVADALDYIHQNKVNHLDIKPANIMIRRDNDEPVIIDFGVSKQYDEQKDQTTTTPPGVSNGYSPLEQYKPGGVSSFSPQADIYALGATLYKLLTGDTPPNASDMLNDGLPPMSGTVSPNVRRAIEKAMQPRRDDRPESIKMWKLMLSANTDLEETVIAQSIVPAENERTQIFDTKKEDVEYYEEEENFFSRYKYAMLLAALGAVLGAYFLLKSNGSETDTLTAGAKTENTDRTSESKGESTADADTEKNSAIIDRLISNMVEVEGGTFTMGATYEQDISDNDEYPLHDVTLSSYKICRYEVTQEEWEAVMDYNPASFVSPKRPVEFVSWNDCQRFIRKLNEMTGMDFRLPTEAEWEFAARGGNNSNGYKYAGGNNVNAVGWNSINSGGKTKEVGLKSPNELGLYDMTGNLWEWCSDWYDSYDGDEQINPNGPDYGSSRVLRGGGWNGGDKNCRVSNRDGRTPDYSSDRLGLRLAI